MKPSLLHYAFARNWPYKGYVGIWMLLGVMMVILMCPPSRAMLGDAAFLGVYLISLVLAPALFALMSLPVAFIVLVPLYRWGERLAGAPFRVGDRVRILVGPHRGQVVEVYELWETRRQIRVRLGWEDARDVRDVYSLNQVIREESVS